MEHNLVTLMRERISVGLKRATITTCSQWAERYRVMGMPFPGLFTFKYHPWLKAIHDCNAEMMVSQKAAQLGLTETGLNIAFKAIFKEHSFFDEKVFNSLSLKECRGLKKKIIR